MTRRSTTLPAAYFDALYRDDPDPWSFRTSAYEAGKYAATLGLLRRPRYRRALEVGCSIGVFTRQLAPRCDGLLAIDASERALALARRTCAGLAQVRFVRAAVPAEFPCGSTGADTDPVDLIVLSEVLYYLSAEDVRRTATLCDRALAPDGEIVLCHWLGETDYPLSGDDAAETFVAAIVKRRPAHESIRRQAYRLDHLATGSAKA